MTEQLRLVSGMRIVFGAMGGMGSGPGTQARGDPHGVLGGAALRLRVALGERFPESTPATLPTSRCPSVRERGFGSADS